MTELPHKALAVVTTMNPPTLTLDTNLLHEYWKQRDKSEVVERLLLLARQGRVDLAVTARVHEDVPRPPLAHKLDELRQLGVRKTGSVTRLGFWVLGRDMLADEAFRSFHPTASELAKQFGEKPPDWRDWDHLHAHYLLRRDAFLTWDGGIVCLAETLKDRFGIVVMTPEQYLQAFDAEKGA